MWVLLVAEQLAVRPPGMVVAIAGATVMAVALVARTRHPLLAVLVVAATFALEAPLGVSTKSTSLPILPIFWVVFLTFAVLHGDRRWMALTALVVATVSAMIFDGGRLDPANLLHNALFAAALCVPAALTGVYVASRHRYLAIVEEAARAREAQREAEVAAAVAEERLRVARELHDVIAHGVGLMGLQAGAVRRRLLPEQEDLAQVVHSIEATGRSAIEELRQVLGVLRDPQAGTAPQPSVRDLPALVAAARAAGQQVDFTVEGREEAVPSGVAISTYRIVQELITNARKHAPGGELRLHVECAGERVRIEASNPLPVASLAGAAPGGGQGLVGMRERVNAYGGSLRASQVDDRFLVEATLPTLGESRG
jgi:signal transduction histidine kinase